VAAETVSELAKKKGKCDPSRTKWKFASVVADGHSRMPSL
jgi:hypothetical protein